MNNEMQLQVKGDWFWAVVCESRDTLAEVTKRVPHQFIEVGEAYDLPIYMARCGRWFGIMGNYLYRQIIRDKCKDCLRAQSKAEGDLR